MSFIVRLHTATAALKRLVRTGWRDRGVPEPESVAAHAYGVALLTLLMAEERQAAGEDIDILTAVRMALLHDLPESVTGDLTPPQRRALFGRDPATSRAAKRDAEERALVDLLEDAPGSIARRWGEAWRTYRAGSTPEARLVREADAADCVLQAVAYRRDRRPDRLDVFAKLLDDITDARTAGQLRAAWDDCDA